MPNLTSVHVTAGVPDLGTGDVSTLDAVLAVIPAALAANGGLKVEGVAGGVAVPVSSTTLATAAKQPAIGTAGTASADVITVQGVASMTALKVDGSAVTQPVSGTLTAITNVVHVDDNAGSLTVDGTFWQATQPVSGSVTATVTAGTVQGIQATSAATTSNPIPQGGRAATANPTAVTDGQLVYGMFDKLGKLITVDAIRTLKGSQKTSISASTSETTIVTQVASTFLDLYGLILANSGSTTTKVDIRDTTGGSIIATIEVPTLETRGFMLTPGGAIPQTTVNTNWTAQCTSSTTALEVTAFYVKNI